MTTSWTKWRKEGETKANEWKQQGKEELQEHLLFEHVGQDEAFSEETV